MSVPAHARMVLLASVLTIAACGAQGDELTADPPGLAETGAASSVGGASAPSSTASSSTASSSTASSSAASSSAASSSGASSTSAPSTIAPPSSSPSSTAAPSSSSSAAPAVDDVVLDPQEIGAFTSPSGNIACRVSADDGASCYIDEKQWTIDEPEGCAGLDFGNAIEVTVRGAAYACYTDFPWDPAAPSLPYGATMTAGRFTCESATTGVTCLGDGGAGFRIARAVGELITG